MSAVIVLGVVAAVVIGVAYLERRALKADVVAAELKLEGKANAFLAALRGKEATIRTKIAADVAGVLAAAKAKKETALAADEKWLLLSAADVRNKAKLICNEFVAEIEAELGKLI